MCSQRIAIIFFIKESYNLIIIIFMLATYLNCVKLKLLNNVKINFDINNEDDFEIFKTLRRIVIIACDV